MPLYHLSAPSTRSRARDVAKPVGDGLPETLPEWIRSDGLTHLKIKLNGDDLGWDVERVVAHRPRDGGDAAGSAASATWCYSLDFNERCPNVGYLLEFLAQGEGADAGAASSASPTSSSRRPAT